jgi:hypothetical protein
MSSEKQPELIKYTNEEAEYRGMIIKRILSAKNQRDTNHVEFDDMDFLTRYEANSKAANAYIPPKLNKIDTRIVTGTTREKENTILSALLNYNLEPNVEAFDKDDMMIVGIGETMEAMIKKSREIEMYDDKRPLIYKEALDQGDCFVEEVTIERQRVEKEIKGHSIDFSNLKSIRWDKKLTKAYTQCEARLKNGTQVFLGNVKEFDEWEQPYIITVDVVTYEKAESVYGSWERWKYVPRKIAETVPADNIAYRDWSLLKLEANTCEILKYYDKWGNEMMIMVNGVMMLPIRFPLTAISPSGEYPLAKLSIEPISKFFAYSNSIPSKTKVEQALLDEMIKSIVTVFQQKVKPPMANNTGRALSPRIFDPGHIANNVDPTRLSPILLNQGLTPAEFNVFSLVKQIVDEKTTSPAFSGNVEQGQQTATEIIELKKQQMMKLGFVIWGVLRFERRLAWLRTYNILENWTRPIGEEVDQIKQEIRKVYQTITVKSPIEDGREGRKIISMNPELSGMMSEEQIMAEEDFLSESSGIPTRKVYLNPDELRTIKAKWFITVNPTEKDSTALDRVLYVKSLQEAGALFGIQRLNLHYHMRRFAILNKEDPEKYFLPDSAMPQMAGELPGTSPVESQIMKPLETKEPSLNALMQ